MSRQERLSSLRQAVEGNRLFTAVGMGRQPTSEYQNGNKK